MANTLFSGTEYLLVPGTVAAAPGVPYGLLADVFTALTKGTLSGSFNTSIVTLSQAVGSLGKQDFFYDYYFRIWIDPVGPYDVGGISSTQTIPILVWNAYPYTAKTLASIDVDGLDENTFAMPEDPPDPYRALEQKQYVLTLSGDGMPAIDVLITWHFTGEPDQTLEVTGFRTKTWPIDIDWREPPLDRYEWMTDVMASRANYEQRVALRQAPRRTIEATFVITDDQLGAFDALLYSWGAKGFLVPMWYDVTYLSQLVAASGTRLYCDTTDREFNVDGFALIGTDIASSVAMQIEEVYADGLLLRRPLVGPHDAGEGVWPAHGARITSPATQTQYTAGVVDMRVSFQITDQDEIAVTPSDTTFMGYQVLTREHNWLYSITRGYERSLSILDNNTALPKWIDLSGWAQITRQLKVLLADRSNRRDFIGWLSSVVGRLTPFWREDRETMLTMTDNQAPGDTALLHIKPIGFPTLLFGQPGRMALSLRHIDGTVYYRQILAAQTDATSGDELLTLDSNLPASVPGDWRLITYLELVRLDTDSIEIAHQSAEVSESQFTIRSIKQ